MTEQPDGNPDILQKILNTGICANKNGAEIEMRLVSILLRMDDVEIKSVFGKVLQKMCDRESLK